MSEYIMLLRFTGQGVEKIKQSPDRIKAAKKYLKPAVQKLKPFYAVLGRYDTVCIVEAPDDETIARLSLQTSALGNVHAETLRAFTEDQFLSIVNKLA